MRSVNSLLFLLTLVKAHGDHSFDLSDEDIGMSYAERHMHTEHHIDSFDLNSCFALHDLNSDGQWDEAEIQAVYGLHHHSVKGKMPPDHVDSRADVVVKKVLEKLDKDKNGKISEAEFVAGGMEGLPSFEGYKDLGHHYDEESEYFLHHEENQADGSLYHSTPETQTDEAYSHPEDIEHFRHHQHIEDEEDARERNFEGLPETADLGSDHPASDPLADHAHAEGEGPSSTYPSDHGAQEVMSAGDTRPPRASPNRLPDVVEDAKAQLKEAAEKVKGKVRSGHGAPRSPEERLKAGVPYKYKMRKGLRADEF